MHVAELACQGHRIYAAAIAREDCSRADHGFHAAVVVIRHGTGSTAREVVFRDEQLEDGKLWEDPEQALQFALEVGEAAIRAQAWLAAYLMAQQASSAASSRRAA